MLPDAVKPFSPEDTKVTFQSASMYDKKDYNKINFCIILTLGFSDFGGAVTGLLIVPTLEGTSRNHQFLEGIIADIKHYEQQ